ncbi:MAG TPA: NADAR domain-containing protein [Lacunisphaera sp.]|nr:NADAR domain-containing protein [Lacunisphaera sp.]
MKTPKDKSRVYERSEVVSFRATDGPFGGLSNMAPGFPVIVNGIRIRSVEALYQALRYPHIPEAQQLIINQHSPMTAKMVGRRYIEQTRTDWDEIKVTLMRWCLRLKLAQHWDLFSAILLSTGERMVVEDSRKDPFWGAQPQEDGTLAGKNVLGRLLMELREQLKTDPDPLRASPRPQFPEAILLGHEIRADSTKANDSNLEDLFRHTKFRPHDSPSMSPSYPKRLIEVDLPIKRISAHARRENGVRHGHFKTLHMWWARRPLAACRAVLCAMLWPDPADGNCPSAFRDAAAEQLYRWALDQMTLHTADSAPVFSRMRASGTASALCEQPELLRAGLFEFLADFADWERSKNTDFLATARALVRAAHLAIGGSPETAPRVFDPFAGGGSIPLEALRLGMESCASDLNPVAVLLNRMAIEQLPAHGLRLADAVSEAGDRIKERAIAALAPYYPADGDGATPITYLWARTILSEAPDPTGEGIPVEIPLIRGFWLRKKAGRLLALRWVRDAKGVVVTDVATVTYADGSVKKVRQPRLEIFQPKNVSDLPGPVVQRGSATCPVTGHTTPVKSVRAQLKKRRGGTDDARLLAVATLHPSVEGRGYRLAETRDLEAIRIARTEADRLRKESIGGISVVPDEALSPNELRRISIPIYGMERWGDLFSSRQLVALTTLRRLIAEESAHWARNESPDFARALRTALAFALSKQTDLANGLCSWKPDAECPVHMLARQAIPMVWDFAESVGISDSSGSWASMVERTAYALSITRMDTVSAGHVVRCSATSHWLPTDSAQVFFTDPPYYDAVPYAYLSDFFYVWLRRCLADGDPELARLAVVPKDEEIVVDRPHELSQSDHDIAYYERELGRAFAEAKRVLAPEGIGSIVFASKTTASWEAILGAVVNAGWVITASWPIDTEMETRVSAQGQARLASSVHLVVRPREGFARREGAREVGDWRDVLQELPKRIHEWMPRLANEGVVGADAIFACLGPALEIFSRYRRVEKANGDEVKLGEYLEHVWAAVSREALSSITSNSDLASLEPDARITAMWLWTLSGNKGNEGGAGPEDKEDDDEEEEEADTKKAPAKGGYSLEYDAARKIAQGLGANLEDLTFVVEVKGEQARLLPVAERTAYLFGKDQAAAPGAPVRGKKKVNQMDLFSELTRDHPGAAEAAWEEKTVSKPGATVLDRVHQAMILFATGRGDALKRFLVEDGVGREAAFWRLAQALSALYPGSSQEKRWVDGVLARKKGLGL